MRKSDGGLRRLFHKHLPNVHWTSIESRSTMQGIPDLEGCEGGVSFWIECKAAVHWRVHMRPFQIAWLARRTRAGGRCFIAVRRGAELRLYTGSNAARLAMQGLVQCPALGVWGGGPRQWPWPWVLAMLRGGAATHWRPHSRPRRAAGAVLAGGR
jgi:hypothetical protein